MQTTLYIATHKPVPLAKGPGYHPIQVGFGESFADLRDNVGENIAEKNRSFCELTALYWLWKNDRSDLVGLVHYRRYFATRIAATAWDRIAPVAELEKLLACHDVILPKKRHYIIETNYSQYAHAHHERDLLATRQILAEQQPSYLEAFDRVMARRSGHRFNMLVAHRRVLEAYCSWLFPILFELETQIDVSAYDEYNARVFGFLSERLLDVWLENQHLNIKELSVVSTYRVNWFSKGLRFIMRKARGSLGNGGGTAVSYYSDSR